jgi:hypothetical protein
MSAVGWAAVSRQPEVSRVRLPWNLTFADAAEHVESGHSQVAIIDLGKVPAERLHPKAAYSRCRPYPVSRVAPKRPDGEPTIFLFRFYEAAVRDLTHPAIMRRPQL